MGEDIERKQEVRRHENNLCEGVAQTRNNSPLAATMRRIMCQTCSVDEPTVAYPFKCNFKKLESMEGRFLSLPRSDTGKLTGALVVALHQGELVQQGAPLLQVVHVLEGHLFGSVHEVH